MHVVCECAQYVCTACVHSVVCFHELLLQWPVACSGLWPVFYASCTYCIIPLYPRKADKGDTWCTGSHPWEPERFIFGSLRHKKGDILFGLVIRGSGKLQCVPFITLWGVVMYATRSACPCPPPENHAVCLYPRTLVCINMFRLTDQPFTRARALFPLFSSLSPSLSHFSHRFPAPLTHHVRCNKLLGDQGNTGPPELIAWIAIMVAVFLAGYASMTISANWKEVFSLSGESTARAGSQNAAGSDGVAPGQLHLDVEGEGGGGSEPRLAGHIGYSVAGFHVMIAFASCYVAMQMTNWNQVPCLVYVCVCVCVRARSHLRV